MVRLTLSALSTASARPVVCGACTDRKSSMAITRPHARHVPRIARRHAAHRLVGAACVAVRARLAGRASLLPQRLGVLGAQHAGIVRRIEVVAETDRPAARERIAVGVLLGHHRTVQRLQIGDEMDQLLRREGALHAPRRHHRQREHHARIPELLVEIRVGQLSVADGGQIGADVARRPHVVTGNQVTAGARPLLAIQEQRPALLGIPDDARTAWSPATRSARAAGRRRRRCGTSRSRVVGQPG